MKSLIISLTIVFLTMGLMVNADVIEVDSIEQLRLEERGQVYRVTGEAVLTHQIGWRYQKYFQDKDGTAAILIDDDDGNITTEYEIYDGVTGLTGELGEHGGMLQLQPRPGDDPGDPISHDNVIIPREVTLQQLIDDEADFDGPGFDEYQAELVKVMDVEFLEEDTFDGGEMYEIEDPTAQFFFRQHFFGDADYDGDPLPTEPHHITVLPVAQWEDGRAITARSWADFEPVEIVDAPTAHAENFEAETVDYRRIEVNWDDPDTEIEPRAYLVKASDVSYEDIDDPVDGEPEPTALMEKNVPYGREEVTFDGLDGDTTYYFKIFPYSNSGEDILYLVDDAPEASATTDEAPTTLHYWHFNTGRPDEDENWEQPIPAVVGDGEITYTMDEALSFTGTEMNADYGDAPGGSFAPRNEANNGEYIEITAPTTGYDDILLSYATRRSGGGFREQHIEYSLDGGDNYQHHMVLTEDHIPTDAWDVVNINFGNIEEANDNPDFMIRITFYDADTALGNNRLDNIRISDAGEYVTSVSSQTWTLFE